ncbi:MAG: hypothetical protein RBT65_18415 [Methanolobus sp.]|nr:hypothetical protein [Methanolobus sp.]
MNKDCEKFANLLAEDVATSEDSAFIAAHSTKCASCRELLGNYDNLTSRLQIAAKLSDTDKNRIFLQIRSRLANEQKDQHSSSISLFSWFVGNFRWSLALAAVVALLVAVMVWQDTDRTFYQATGLGKILLTRGEVELSSDPVQLEQGVAIKLVKGQICLNWQGNEQMTIAGNLDFTPEDKAVRVDDGSAAFDFRPSAVGYKVFTPKLVLTIVGTSIDLNISKDSETVTVTKGRITWEVPNTLQKGDLAAGNFLRIAQENHAIVEKVESATKVAQPEETNVASEPAGEMSNGEIREPELFQGTSGQ